MDTKQKSMFARIMAMVLAVIAALTVAMSSACWFALRNQQINSRLQQLEKEARDIAYLAAQNTSSSALTALTGRNTALSYLQDKAKRVFEDYGAYMLVLDRRGRVMDNLREAYTEDPAFVESLNDKDLYAAFLQVLGGQTISVRTMVGGAPRFTVGVPFMQKGQVLGAVLIQTKAQSIEGDLWSWLWRVLAMAALAAVAAAVGIFVYVRSVLRPMKELTQAARAMAGGNFAVRVHPEKATPETMELSEAFNTMADKLNDVESNRREFVANVSHELRSPITSIAGFVEGMQDGTIPVEEHAHYLAIVGDETRRLTKLIGDLLALSRLERDDAALELTDFDMCEMLRRAIIRRMNDLEDKRMEIVCDFRLEPCFVRADSDRMEQVVVNLVDNAIKFTPEGGCITLGTEDAGERCVVRVRDNGTGILPEDRPRVFDRFFTADRAHTAGKGTGLGLAISQRILEMHGERIYLEDVDAGACFAFTMKKGQKPDGGRLSDAKDVEMSGCNLGQGDV